MNYGKVAVLLGGPSSERSISIKSGKAIAEALRRKGIDVLEIGETGDIEQGIKDNMIDLAFIALHGSYGEDGQVQSFLEKMNVAYTGSDSKTSAITMDKIKTKQVLEDNNVLVASYQVLNFANDRNIDIDSLDIAMPLVIKPATEGSSVGLNIIFKKENFKSCLEEAFKYCPQVMLEKYIKGKELTVGVLGEDVLPVINIVPKLDFYNFEAKYTKGKTDYIVPAKLDESIYKQVQETAFKVHNCLGCRDLSRVDFILEDETNKIYVLEINTIPGFTETSLLPKSALQYGLEFDDLVLKILDMAALRIKK